MSSLTMASFAGTGHQFYVAYSEGVGNAYSLLQQTSSHLPISLRRLAASQPLLHNTCLVDPWVIADSLEGLLLLHRYHRCHMNNQTCWRVLAIFNLSSW
jgi:hypothetical protein